MSEASERRASPKVSRPSVETKRMRRVQVMVVVWMRSDEVLRV